MELRALGAIEVRVDGRARPLSPAQRLLLTVLLVERRRVVSADALAAALWGDRPPPTARATLQTHLSKLRRSMGDVDGVVLVNRPPGYALDVAPDHLDADRFDAAVAAARPLVAAAPDEALTQLDQALSLWNGPALAEFAEASWARAEAARLDELRLVAFELRNDARLACGQDGAAIAELEGLVQEHPLRERYWEQLMVALHRCGRQGEALRAAQTLRVHLGDELGLEPSAAFRALEGAIAVDDDSVRRPADPGASPAPSRARPSSAVPIWAPGLATELVGRAAVLEDLSAVVLTTRLLTLTGPGGVGKSSVAAELARRLGDRFPDGLRFVELATVHDALAVSAAVAQALGVERRSERSLAESITEVLGTRQMLLVFDNCEHVIEPVGALITRLVRWCPQVRILATSREPIGIAGETIWPVAPLVVPTRVDAPLAELLTNPAMQVFIARAEEAAPSFEITERSAPAIAQLCIELDGLPLALELAAARMASMSPRQLADRLHERFELLGGGAGRVVRHRTLLDVVQWSYELLTPKERILLARLSVFAGGFDLEAAEQVCSIGDLGTAEVAHLLAVLVDKSLVVATHADDRVRYMQLETLRQFGAARLQEQSTGPAVRRAHIETFVALAELGAPALDGAEEAAWADRLEGELGNLRVALHAAIAADDADAALRLVAATRELAFRRIRYEVVGWAEAAVALDGARDHPLLPTVLAVVAYGSFVRGELDGAIDLAREAIAHRERLGVPSCGLPERVLSNAAFYRRDHEVGLAWMAQMARVAEAAGADGRLAHALYMESVAHTSLGDHEQGGRLAVASTTVAERSGSPTALAQATYASGLAVATIDVAVAIDRLDDAAALADSVGNRWMQAFAMTEAMWLRAGRGEIRTALRGYRQVVDTWFQGGDWANQWLSLRHLAGIFADVGRNEEAALIFGAVEAAGASTALPFSPADADQIAAVAHTLAERLGPDAAADASRRGARMRDDATVAAALRTIAELT